TSFSLLSIPRFDHRLRYSLWKEINQIKQEEKHLWSYVAFTSVHPANLRLEILNRFFDPIFQNYSEQVNLVPCEDWLRQADLFVFESTAGLMLVDRVKLLNAKACWVYRVSDDLRFMHSHPALLAAESRHTGDFDIISVPSPSIYSIFQDKTDSLSLDYHALRKDLFDQPSDTPYLGAGPHVVFSGIAYFDSSFLDIASRELPEWQFHIIGPIRNLPKRQNVIAYGEMPFVETIRYLQHADVGLQPLIYRPGSESFTHSLKIMQYTYCKLPIVAPHYIPATWAHWFSYISDNPRSIVQALEKAASYPRSKIDASAILSWTELTARWCRTLNLN
ncbi:MAG: glucuronosyltransferase, partial [Cyanobacteria bacterium J06631_9]